MAVHFTRFKRTSDISELLAKNIYSKNGKKTTRQTTSAIIQRIFAELSNPLSPKLANKHAL